MLHVRFTNTNILSIIITYMFYCLLTYLLHRVYQKGMLELRVMLAVGSEQEIVDSSEDSATVKLLSEVSVLSKVNALSEVSAY